MNTVSCSYCSDKCIYFCPHCSIGLLGQPLLCNRLNNIWLIIKLQSQLCWVIVLQNTTLSLPLFLFCLGNLKSNMLVCPNYVVRAFLPLLAFLQKNSMLFFSYWVQQWLMPRDIFVSLKIRLPANGGGRFCFKSPNTVQHIPLREAECTMSAL